MVWSLSVCHKPPVRFSAIRGSAHLCSSCDHDKAVTAELWPNKQDDVTLHGLTT
jgi:hypothetical protein